MWSKKIQQLADDNNGQLPSIIFPAVVIYLDSDECELCAECANKEKEEDSLFNTSDYYLSDDTEELADQLCSECGKSIDPALRQKTARKEHYIASIAPNGGYLPSTCEVFQKREEAIEFLAGLLYGLDTSEEGLSLEEITAQLEEKGIYDLGNEHGSIEACDCDDPQIHSEEELDWEDEELENEELTEEIS